MPALVVIVGPIASGKSTIAAELGSRLRDAGRSVAVLDLDEMVDTIGGFVGLPPERFREAQVVFGRLVGAWLAQGFDVIAHGPFFEQHEDDALLHAAPDDVIPRRVLLRCTVEVAHQRVDADPDRMLSAYPEFLRASYRRVEQLLSTMPKSEWVFDTTTTDVRSIVSELAADLLADGRPDPHALGYQRVDDDLHVPVLLDTMDATGRWPATTELRTWERERLQLAPGARLLDVGCGLGTAGLALGVDLGPDGELVGIDASAAMVDAARDRGRTARCGVRFSIGDAHRLDEPDGSFDAARSERTLQWLADPDRAVAELVRVLRPGGRLCLIDTDWSTLRLDIGDSTVERKVRVALREERGRPSNIGRRLAVVVAQAGCTVVGERTATHQWTSWDPDVEPAPPGCFSMRSLAADLVERGELMVSESDGFAGAIHDAARRGAFSLSLTMHAVVATAPAG